MIPFELRLPYKNITPWRWPHFVKFILSYVILGSLSTVVTIFIYEQGHVPSQWKGSLILWTVTLAGPLAAFALLGLQDRLTYHEGECIASSYCWRIPVNRRAGRVAEISRILVSEVRHNDPSAGFEIRVCCDHGDGDSHLLLLASGYSMLTIQNVAEWLQRLVREVKHAHHEIPPVLLCDPQSTYHRGYQPRDPRVKFLCNRNAKIETGLISEFYWTHVFGIGSCIFMAAVFILMARAMQHPESIASIGVLLLGVASIAMVLIGRTSHGMVALLREEQVSFTKTVLEISVTVRIAGVIWHRTHSIVKKNEILAVKRGTWGVLAHESFGLRCVRVYTLTSEPVELWCGKSEQDQRELVDSVFAWSGLSQRAIV